MGLGSGSSRTIKVLGLQDTCRHLNHNTFRENKYILKRKDGTGEPGSGAMWAADTELPGVPRAHKRRLRPGGHTEQHNMHASVIGQICRPTSGCKQGKISEPLCSSKSCLTLASTETRRRTRCIARQPPHAEWPSEVSEAWSTLRGSVPTFLFTGEGISGLHLGPMSAVIKERAFP